MTTPTHNSPQVAHTTTDRAQLATGGAIPDGEFDALHEIARLTGWVTDYENCRMRNHLPALLAAYEEREMLRDAIATPDAVWTNMLRGTIAKPGQLEYLEQRIAELEMESEARRHLVTGEDIEREMDKQARRIAELEAELERHKNPQTCPEDDHCGQCPECIALAMGRELEAQSNRIAELEAALDEAQHAVRQCDQDHDWRRRETILRGGAK